MRNHGYPHSYLVVIKYAAFYVDISHQSVYNKIASIMICFHRLNINHMLPRVEKGISKTYRNPMSQANVNVIVR